MIDAQSFPADFDEESFFDQPPPTAPESSPGLSLAQKGALALVGVGLLSTVIQIFGGPLAGTWPGFLSSLGLLTLGGSLSFWLALKDTQPGIKHDGIFHSSLLARGALGWVAGILMTGFYVLVYFQPALLGQPAQGEAPTGLVALVDPLARAVLRDADGNPGQASSWFLYGVLYCLFMIAFGVRMLMKYRHNRYHQVRTLSVVFFQCCFAWLLPNLLARFQKPSIELNGVWPLKHEYLLPAKVEDFLSAGVSGTTLLLWALGLVVVATPVLTYFYGKRWYCSWVCGCGGLAETLGDPWRQNSDKSPRAWKIERILIHSVLVAVLVMSALVWIAYAMEPESLHVYDQPGPLGWADETVKHYYGLLIGSIFSGVVGVGFYPIFGSRVWCRFGCPQAAILGLFQRLFSRFRITTNGGQCMSCGNCSTYCEMGIDVRAYAQRGENIVRASCVGCGVCAAACPRGVLRLENGDTHGDRFELSQDPLAVLREGLKEPKIY